MIWKLFFKELSYNSYENGPYRIILINNKKERLMLANRDTRQGSESP